MDLEKIQSEVRNILSYKRYIHSVGVMERAEELAKIYGADVNEAKIVGIAHDIAKEMTDEEMYQYVYDNDIELDEIEKKHPKLLHAKIGADICKKKYNFTESMEKAVLYHTTGSVNMDLLAKIIYLADETEKNRDFENLEYATNLANTDIDEAMLYCLDIAIKDVIGKARLIHHASISTRNFFLEKVKEK